MSSEWSSGLCSCENLGNCCYAYWCYPCANASARTNYDSSNWLLNCCCLTPPITRNIIREGYGIEGNCVGDVCLTMWCPLCVTAQLLNEVEHRGPVTMKK
eukprot:m51a1_g13177 hypothetical protein (100) ;mRNA; f:99147-99628